MRLLLNSSSDNKIYRHGHKNKTIQSVLIAWLIINVPSRYCRCCNSFKRKNIGIILRRVEICRYYSDQSFKLELNFRIQNISLKLVVLFWRSCTNIVLHDFMGFRERYIRNSLLPFCRFIKKIEMLLS